MNGQNQLTGTEEVTGLDHLDSFFRDTYMNGNIERLPKDLLCTIYCSEEGIATDYETGCYLLKLIYEDHQLFLSPPLLAADRILAEAISRHFGDDNHLDLTFLTDYELLSILGKSNKKQVVALVELLTQPPEQIHVSSTISGDGILLGARKIYNKTPLYCGQPFSRMLDGQTMLAKLKGLEKNYELILTIS
ncbi:hypothetical protein SAMN05421736_110150 [Evansella caseinilytica]|uniref:Uncharacterized protein n=1 Tax=Evansella caseinilytica TaxID=1503961 RepID=A0A1H3SD48_9BACI|nr:hypothetical protein [Evansella caseinilytica]SDZ35922.1 hypothetical protein SAMN05421736_110150 [Evansella caseinilytica]